MPQDVLNRLAQAKHAGREKLQDQRGAEAIDDQAAQAVAFGMHEAIGVGDCVEPERLPPQGDGLINALGEKSGIDGFVRVGGEQAQR